MNVDHDACRCVSDVLDRGNPTLLCQAASQKSDHGVEGNHAFSAVQDAVTCGGYRFVLTIAQTLPPVWRKQKLGGNFVSWGLLP